MLQEKVAGVEKTQAATNLPYLEAKILQIRQVRVRFMHQRLPSSGKPLTDVTITRIHKFWEEEISLRAQFRELGGVSAIMSDYANPLEVREVYIRAVTPPNPEHVRSKLLIGFWGNHKDGHQARIWTGNIIAKVEVMHFHDQGVVLGSVKRDVRQRFIDMMAEECPGVRV